ncbi:MAG: hypothetical protein Q9220_003623 [cf. Caloplaca sp. 1 TL-2023]
METSENRGKAAAHPYNDDRNDHQSSNASDPGPNSASRLKAQAKTNSKSPGKVKPQLPLQQEAKTMSSQLSAISEENPPDEDAKYSHTGLLEYIHERNAGHIPIEIRRTEPGRLVGDKLRGETSCKTWTWVILRYCEDATTSSKKSKDEPLEGTIAKIFSNAQMYDRLNVGEISRALETEARRIAFQELLFRALKVQKGMLEKEQKKRLEVEKKREDEEKKRLDQEKKWAKVEQRMNAYMDEEMRKATVNKQRAPRDLPNRSIGQSRMPKKTRDPDTGRSYN